MGYVLSRKRAVLLAGLLTVPVCSTADTQGSPVVIQRKIGSKACELVQHGSLVFGRDFVWIEIEGEKEQLYSPELGHSDYLTASPEISGFTASDVHKSGFELRRESSIPGDVPMVHSLQSNANCPDLESAIAEVEQSRALRRSKLQAKIYQPGSDDVVAATPLQSDQSATPSTPASSPDVMQQAKYHGTVVLRVVVGIDGSVEQTQVVRSAYPYLDKKAAEKASEWKFLPARKRGLPVRSVVPVVFNFDLH